MQRKQLLLLKTPSLVTTISVADTETIIRNSCGYTYQTTQNNYIYSAHVDDTTGEQVLIIDMYRPSGGHEWRYFINKAGQYFRWLTEDSKTSDAGMDYILDYEHYSNCICEKSTNTVISEFFDEKIIENPLEYISQRNLSYKTKKHEDKLNKIRASIDNAMLEIRELPKSVDKWIDNTLLKHSRYIFYEYQAKKQVNGFCSYCKTDVLIDRPKHGSYGTCPACKSRVKFLALGKFHQTNGFINDASFVYFQPTKVGFCAREFRVSRTFRLSYHGDSAYKNQYNDLHELSRVFYEYDECTGFEQKSSYNYGNFRNTGEYRFYRDCVTIHQTTIYPCNLNKLLKKDSRAKHIDYNGIARNCGRLNYDRFINYPYAYKAIENIYKSKLYNIVSDIINSSYNTCGNQYDLNGTNILKSLLITKDELPELQKFNPCITELQLYQEVKAKEKHVDIETLKKFIAFNLYVNTATKCLQLGTLHSVTRYITEQSKAYTNSNWSTPQREMVGIWLDYIDNAKKLEYDLKDHNKLYPKNLKTEHDIAYKWAQKDAKKILLKTLAKIAPMHDELEKRFAFKTKSFLITAPKDSDDLKNEGKLLDHCVYNYAEDVALGKKIILFIRKTSAPDKPLATLELNPNTLELVQCKGFHNDPYPEEKEVYKFVEQWLAAVVNKPRKKAVKSA